MTFLFYTGSHMPSWLRFSSFPLFISRVRLERYRCLPRAVCRWALDSGGFSELSLRGRWTVTPRKYATEVARFREEIGLLDWAAQMDWMCEPHILAKTGLGVSAHQDRTIDNLLELRSIDPDIPWVPVLQGWHPEDYMRHVDEWERRGVALKDEPLVGVGSICRRQSTCGVEQFVWKLKDQGISLHGFGLKKTGLRRMARAFASADSMAWSFAARRSNPMEGHCHASCANCHEYAKEWRADVLLSIELNKTLLVQTEMDVFK